jgi:ribonuclease HI
MLAEEMFPEVNLYTDGGAEPNPGKGGFGVIMTYKGHRKEFSQGYALSTNNRMELMSVIFGLENLKKRSIVQVYSDS